MPKVLNKRTATPEALASGVFVGRPSEWGNPFALDGERTREQVIDYFRQHVAWKLKRNPKWLEPLRGKDLVCFCAPLPCHADVLLELANRATKTSESGKN